MQLLAMVHLSQILSQYSKPEEMNCSAWLQPGEGTPPALYLR